ncbi:MAG: EAL domain-containing protein [Xanthobacteraceae bacterium]|nr:MAG: EAL domain-containing protein [Xanthobacteraceae bacterium]
MADYLNFIKGQPRFGAARSDPYLNVWFKVMLDRQVMKGRILQHWALLATACVGLVFSCTAWFAASVREDRLAELEFSARADNHLLTLQGGINTYLSRMGALRALYNSDDYVSRSEFQIFSEELLRGQNAILAVSWIPRVTHAQREAHELLAVRDGISGYRIKAAKGDGGLVPAPERAEYFPIFYSSREKPDSHIYGLDLNDGGLRQHTLERARDADQIATSPSFKLSAGEGDRNGFFVTLPVYRVAHPHDTVANRRSNLVGFVQGVFQIGVLIETVLKETASPGGLDLYFYAVDSSRGTSRLYFHPSRIRTDSPQPLPLDTVTAGLHWSGEINVGDAVWKFIAAPIPGGPGTASHAGSLLLLAGCLLITLLVMGYILAAHRHAERIHTKNEQLDAALGNMPQALLMFDSSARLVIGNSHYQEMYGLSPDAAKPGSAFLDMVRQLQQGGMFPADPETYAGDLLSAIAQGNALENVTELPDGRTIAIVHHPIPGGGWVTTHEDITSRVSAEAKMSYMALHDTLTNLPNRLFFHKDLESRLAHLARGQKFAILCLDLDNFKHVNDTLGHPCGDSLLRQAADRLRGCMREGDSLARLGGDEFAILQASATEPAMTTSLMTRIIEVIGAPFDIDGQQVVVGVSIGVALAPSDSTDPDQILKLADMALYRAKADGRGTYRFFEPEMDARMQARRIMELDLRKAITKGEFELHYQPLVNLETEQISGFEALIRWNHPERGMVSPVDFIPLAEETALIVPIGEWALRQACEEAAKWPSHISIAVNLSSIQFRVANVAQAVVKALAHSGLSAGRLELEITESVLLLNGESTLNTLHQLRAMGVRISMDDFGTGYSSLSYLHSFPFDKIKIDRSFVHDLSSSENSMAIIRAVTGLGSSLGMKTTGEGVETREELEYLKREGCTEAQGFLFSKAIPAREVASMLAARPVNAKAVA